MPEDTPRCQHCPCPADECSFMCEDCASEADFEVQTLRDEIERLRAIAEQRGEFLFRIMEICREYDSQLARLAAERAGQ